MSPTVPPISTRTTSDAFGDFAERGFDFVGDVRDHLNRLAEIIAAALFGDDRFVEAAGGPVVIARQMRGGEALVVAQVEIGFGAVVGDEHFAVLIRRHGAGIDVQVGIALLEGDAKTAAFEQAAHGGRCYAFPERRNHAARHKNVFWGGPQGRVKSSGTICVRNIMRGNAVSVKLRISFGGNNFLRAVGRKDLTRRTEKWRCRERLEAITAEKQSAEKPIEQFAHLRVSLCCELSSWIGWRIWRGTGEVFSSLDVGGHVNAYGVVHRLDHVHVEAVFQPAELFQLFDAF